MLKEIAIVTLTVANPGPVAESWSAEFDYRTVERGVISSELASHWQAPQSEGADYLLMQPANGAPVYVRLVEDKLANDYRPMTTHGWNATELLVRDTDKVAAKLRQSPFDIIGEPRDLWNAPDAPRAMQALGQGNELLYLTTNPQARAGLMLGDDMPLVERPFIMVAGGPSMEAFQAFYERLGLTVTDPAPFRITMISKANNLPLDTTYPLAVVNLAPGYLIEVDELPPTIGPKPVAPGRLPPGIAVVSFTADTMPADLPWLRAPAALAEFPYDGRRSGLLQGPGGELIEVILAD